MAPLRIEVTGESTIHIPPERAVVSLSVYSEGTSQEQVASDVAATSTELRSILDELTVHKYVDGEQVAAPVTKWSNSSLSTGSFIRYHDSDDNNGDNDNEDKKTRIHTASTTFKATFRDFARLGTVATTISTMPHVGVAGIEWTLTDDTKNTSTSQCRGQAVRDAVAKAGDYARALGRGVPEVVEVRDSSFGGGGGRVFAQAAAFRSNRPDERENLNFRPEDVALECSVNVVFEEKG